MSLLRCLTLSFFLLSAALSGAWAQLPSPFQLSTTPTSFSINGIQLTASCAAACANKELVAVSGSRGAISFEVVGDGGTAGGTQSAALTEASGSATTKSLTINFTVADASSSRLVTGWALTTAGTNNVGSSATAGGTATITGVPASTLIAALNANTSSSQTVSSPASGVTDFGTPTNSFSFTDVMSLNNAGATTTRSTFNIFSQLITFHAVPEPATLSVLLLGLAGVAAARRGRRKAGSQV